MMFSRYLKTVILTTIMAIVVGSCATPATATIVPSSTNAAAEPSSTPVLPAGITRDPLSNQFNLPPIFMMVDNSQSMVQDDLGPIKPCDSSQNLRYRLPLMMLNLFDEWKNSAVINNYSVGLRFIQQNNVSGPINDANVQVTLSNQLKGGWSGSPEGSSQIGAGFSILAGDLQGNDEFAFVFTDGDFRVNRPSGGVNTDDMGLLKQSLDNIVSQNKKVHIQVVLLCSERLDSESKQEWSDINDSSKYKDILKIYGLGDNRIDGNESSFYRLFFNDFLTATGFANGPDQGWSISSLVDRGWGLVLNPPLQTPPPTSIETPYSIDIPPHTLRLKQGIITLSGNNDEIHSYLDGKDAPSDFALVSPNTNCEKHTLAYYDLTEPAIYWWNVERPRFELNKLDDLVITNDRGEFDAPINVFSASGEDVTAQMQNMWSDWEKCIDFYPLDAYPDMALEKMPWSIHLKAEDFSASEPFVDSKMFTIVGTWDKYSLSLPVSGKEKYFRVYYPTLSVNSVSAGATPPATLPPKIFQIAVPLNFIGEELYPAQLRNYILPRVYFPDDDCPFSNSSGYPVPSETFLGIATSMNGNNLTITFAGSDLKVIAKCQDMDLKWKWNNLGEWKTPPDIRLTLGWQEIKDANSGYVPWEVRP